jgi:hypothetical protein
MEMKSGDLNPLTLVTQKKSQDMEHEPTLLKGNDMTRYAYHKPFTVKFPDKCALQNSLKTDITRGPGQVQGGVQDQKKALVLGCIDGA